MKVLAAAALILLAPKPGVRFDAEGIRVGDVLVQGTVLELKDLGHQSLLASGSSLEPLAASVDVEVAADRVVTLEPGVRVSRAEGGVRFSTHGTRKVRFATSEGTLTLESPVLAAATAEGWMVGDRKLTGAQLRVSTETQDEDANLDQMKRSADKIRTGGVPRLSTRHTRLYWGNPLDPANAANSINVRLIPQISPAGIP